MRTGTSSGGMHGEASFQGQLVMMGQGALERSRQSPRDAGAATMGVFIYLDDVDKHYAVAKAAGAEIVDPPKTAELTRRSIPRGIPGSSPRRRRASPAGRLLLLQKAAWPATARAATPLSPVGVAVSPASTSAQSLVGRPSTLGVLP